MGIIDIHTHAFPDELAERAMKHLQSEADWKAALDGRVSSLLASMDESNIDVSVVCPIATKPEQVEGILQWCLSIHSDRIMPFPSIHPLTKKPEKWLRQFRKAGFAGIKLHPMYQDFQADDPRVMPIYKAAAGEGLAVLIHCGRDVAFPPDDDRATPARVRHVLEAVPALKLIATHMGGWRMWDESDRELVGGRAWLETSFSLQELPASKALAMIQRHGTDKVMFGTDSPWADQSREIERVRGLGLPPADLEKVLFANAARLLSI